jgi:hypothetical protein
MRPVFDGFPRQPRDSFSNCDNARIGGQIERYAVKSMLGRSRAIRHIVMLTNGRSAVYPLSDSPLPNRKGGAARCLTQGHSSCGCHNLSQFQQLGERLNGLRGIQVGLRGHDENVDKGLFLHVDARTLAVASEDRKTACSSAESAAAATRSTTRQTRAPACCCRASFRIEERLTPPSWRTGR